MDGRCGEMEHLWYPRMNPNCNVFVLQGITEGALCTSQAALKQVGIVGVSLTCVN